jgi:homoserine kinase
VGAALSGAGPAVLVIVDGEAHVAEASEAILKNASVSQEPELLVCQFEQAGANQSIETTRD